MMIKGILACLYAMIGMLIAQEVQLPVGKYALAGEINKAAGVNGAKSKKVVFIISGSGPTDRDGNTVGAKGKNNSLKYLSEFLNAGGVDTLRVDKRGVAKSLKAGRKEKDLRFSGYVEDAKLWVSFLKQLGYEEIIIIGHSEGALVAKLAAEHKAVTKLVSLAGVGRPASEALKWQLKRSLPELYFPAVEQAITTLAEGKTLKKPPLIPHGMFRASVQPYLISYLAIDPTKHISKLTIPVLIVQGTTDIQVTVEDAKSLHAAKKDSQLVVIKGMNHVLKKVEGSLAEQLPTYYDPRLSLHPELGNTILKFVLKGK